MQSHSKIHSPQILVEEDDLVEHLICESELPDITAHKELSPRFRVQVSQSVDAKPQSSTKVSLSKKLIASPIHR